MPNRDNDDIAVSRLAVLTVLAAVPLLLSRFIHVCRNIWSAKHRSKLFIVAELRSEFDKKYVKSDIFIAVISMFASVQLVPFETQPAACLFCVVLSNAFRRRAHEPAIGLAWSFYFGYLKKVLPKFSGNVNRSRFKEKTCPKLLILVPVDCKIHPSLRNVDKRISFVENLEPHQENVAGIQERRYIHSSYHIEDKSFPPFLVAVEYATPLNTLRDMYTSTSSMFSESERDRQVLLFYENITDIMENFPHENGGIKNRVEFVFLPKNANVVDKILETVKNMKF